MIAVSFDRDCDQIWISGMTAPYPARTLVAEAVGGLITIHRKGQAFAEVAAPYDQFCDATGAVCPDPVAALAHLRAVLGRWPDASGVVPVAAAEALGGHRIVRLVAPERVALARSGQRDDAEGLLGLTLAAAEADRPVDVRTHGPVEEPSWSFAPGPVFLGPDGGLVQAAPSHGFVCQIGTALAPTRLLVALGEPYLLAA